MDHSHENDPRITITTDAFKILADHWIHRALVIFRNKDSENYRLSYLTISLDINDKNKAVKKYSNARRYSFYLGSSAKIKTPEQQLIKKGRVKDIEDLLSRFSVEVVNKQFYFEVAKFFDDLISVKNINIMLPGISHDDQNTRKSFAVRLIGRIMFCWFLNQKKSNDGQLIPDELLSSKVISDNYYHNILEPLFFGVLNTSIESRDIRSELFDKVPYLNGGLFNPQTEDYYELDRDTFSSRYINTLKINDEWFKNFFELLETYNFTIDENTIFDQELSVDPEMLGRIFENLLAKKINPETGGNEQKETGTFYTPRQIVDYMVDESLIEYFSTKTNIDKNKLSALVSYDLNDDAEYPLSYEEKNILVKSIDLLKIIDPACGSGAYPIGVLQKIVYILQVIDPECKLWLEQKLKDVPDLYKQKIINNFNINPFNYIRKQEVIKNSIFGIDIQPIAVDVSRLRCFLTLIVESEINDNLPNRGIEPLPNLDFKFVCANTLIHSPEQYNDDENHLFENDFQEKLATSVDRYFSSSGENKRAANNEIHKLIDNKVEEKLNHLNNFVFYHGDKKMETIKAEMNKKQISLHSKILLLWSSYKNIFENKPVDFFDTKYFFPSVKDGFDIVIGNPPYVQLQKFKGQQIQEDLESQKYETFEKTGDLYCLFYERGLSLSKKESGLLCYITSNKWMKTGYGESLRSYFIKHNPLLLLDLGQSVFESAMVDSNILLIQNTKNENRTTSLMVKDNKDNLQKQVANESTIINFNYTNPWFIGSNVEQKLKNKIEEVGTPLKDKSWNIKINYGIKTGLNDAFVIDKKTKDQLVTENPKSMEILNPILGGKDLMRFNYSFGELYLINSHNGVKGSKLKRVEIDEYPAIKNYLDSKEPKLSKRQDYGDTKYNLRNCAYLEEFQKEKVAWLNLNRKWKYSYVEPGIYVEASLNFISGEKHIKFLVGILSSKVHLWYFRKTGRMHDDGGFMCKIDTISNFPVPKITEQNNKYIEQIESMVNNILDLKKENMEVDTKEIEYQIDEIVMNLYNFTEEEKEIIRKS
jgi:hypothetical protein